HEFWHVENVIEAWHLTYVWLGFAQSNPKIIGVKRI
ncbi:unnamed protein product, partial [marine sediment metagenome]